MSTLDSKPSTNPVPQLPPPARNINDAKRQYMEQYASALVMNRYLLVAVLAVSIGAVGALGLSFRMYATLKDSKPWIIRIDDVGRAEAVQYAWMTYHPQAKEIRYFLTCFVHDHYSRNRPTLRDDFAPSLFFLSSKLASARMEENRKSKAIENYIVSASEDVEVNFKNIVLQDLRAPPFHAAVDFEKIYRSSSDGVELRREKYVASIEFMFRDDISNDMIPVNPLGLTITYYRDDQASRRRSRDR
jgi:type IV secretory pathway component VirB8